ncbi:molybdenum cofactor biosynthesis protein MoaE [Hyphomonas sp. FCG-A18]|uniref:molybdenum cofactor biosynthesis protein MoaE n=1 Tax=Hyphomonas sp. FCG-A18 TaxID=3080019 RepID=UPI002B2DDBB4|nr:molybdenum cofactor biosynthesis protein MoaE [Hyphomonas sp. FCG-A18]
MIEVSDAPIDASATLASFEKEIAGAGAVVSFSGMVRDTSASGTVKALHLQAYEPMTRNGIMDAVAQAETRWPLAGVRVLHRTGEIATGQTIVFVATASAHRRAAFEAADFLMDYLKTQAVFWKKEVTENGAVWIEPRAEDYTDSARWAKKEDA